MNARKLADAKWWKIGSLMLLIYTVVMGLWQPVPELNILNESIRNLFFHVPMWFSMMTLMFVNLIYSMIYLNKGNITDDVVAESAAVVGFFMGFLGILTGSVWARVTWGDWWVFEEVKLNGAAAALLVYAAYFVLRGSFNDDEKKARFSAVYAIFAFVMYMVLINVIPRITDSSLHPGNGGNPAFSSYDDLDSSLRMIFYPAVIGWIGLSVWIMSNKIRMTLIYRKIHELD